MDESRVGRTLDEFGADLRQHAAWKRRDQEARQRVREAGDGGEWSAWGDQPDERDAATIELHHKIELLGREEEARKTPAERRADAEEEEETKAADAARVAQSFADMYGSAYGRVKRPGGQWKSASEHRDDERQHRQRARRLRGLVAVEATRLESARYLVAERTVTPQTRSREPRRHGRGRAHRPRGPSAGDDSPEPPRSWGFVAVASRRMLEHERRREARWRRTAA